MEWGKIIQKYSNRALTSPEEWDLEKIVENEAINWFKENYNVGVQSCIAYVIIIFGVQYYMENRPRFDLRKPLLCWSTLLAIFSIVGSIRCWAIFRQLFKDEGIRGIMCKNEFYFSPIGRFWGCVFCISKVIELVDTIFIVLRKQKLIFLHWYHHITVLLFSWHCYGGQNAGGAIFMLMNLIAHSIMYSYYACRAARVRIPKVIALTVTTFQILQMVLGLCTFYYIFQWRNDADCPTTDKHLWYGGLMYGSYLVLFCHFFYLAYIKSPPKPDAKGEVKAKNEDFSTTLNAKVMDVPELPKVSAGDTSYHLRARKIPAKAF